MVGGLEKSIAGGGLSGFGFRFRCCTREGEEVESQCESSVLITSPSSGVIRETKTESTDSRKHVPPSGQPHHKQAGSQD